MIIAAIVQALIGAGGTTAQVEAVVKAAEAAIQAELEAPAIRKRELARERKRAQRAREAQLVTQNSVTSRDTEAALYDETPSNVTHVTRTNVTQRGSPSRSPKDNQNPSTLTLPQNPPQSISEEIDIPPQKANGSATDKPKKFPPSKRCPKGWQPSEAILAVAEAEGFTPEQTGREITKLRDCEFKTAHTDWDAVARNWFRRVADLSRGQGPPMTPAERAQAEEQEGLRRFREREAQRERASVAH